MKVKSETESCSVVSDSLQPHGLYSPWNSPGQNTGVGSLSLLQEIFATQGLGRPPTLQMDSLPAEPQEKPKNTGVCSLSLLQEIFPIQEMNWGLLHCKQILYQLRYQGSPMTIDPACHTKNPTCCNKDGKSFMLRLRTSTAK